ncbi:hypothetical protein GCM10010387_58760 [Streptomyces inusitatus]|uniref:Uncharacterized protein n=1 Tax=Streptomyces inusitatus TaxID=68221 RepID=A0A918V232_9ACTN|nr:hypothetical protein GCM10010387_58760 [Streptomyces inusitatus]
MGATIPMSAALATTPKETANPNTAIASGIAMRIPRSSSSLKPTGGEYPSGVVAGGGKASWESIDAPFRDEPLRQMIRSHGEIY